MLNKLWLDCRLVLGLLAVLAIGVSASRAQAYETLAKAAILIDYDTGQVLYAKNPDEPLPTIRLSVLPPPPDPVIDEADCPRTTSTAVRIPKPISSVRAELARTVFHLIGGRADRSVMDSAVASATGGTSCVDVVEPEWPEANLETWAGWSQLRGRLVPGTAIFLCRRDR